MCRGRDRWSVVDVSRTRGVRAARVVVLAVIAAVGGFRPAAAATVYYMYGTGVGANLASSSGTDQHWNVVALPASATGYPATPYDALVPQSTVGVWIGGGTPQSGTSVGGTTYYWVSTSTAAAPATSGTYSWIMAQDFNVSTSGSYEFNFNATVDNELQFFVGGTLNLSDPQSPAISGGTKIGPTLSGTGIFRNIYTFTGTAFFADPGTYTAYAVVRDWGAYTGVLVTESYYFLAVPEPSTLALGGAALACGWWRMRRRPGRGATES